MSTAPVMSITDELIAGISRDWLPCEINSIEVCHALIRALLAERAELVKDRERLYWMIGQEAFIAHIRTGFSVCWPNLSKWQPGQLPTPMEAVDAAMQAAQ
ncbi:MAG: hypothetical protein K2X80_08510 [Pseudomonadaceae bacterium]|nr:hypothetical protein [Pseudomonadaceae bacterium]